MLIRVEEFFLNILRAFGLAIPECVARATEDASTEKLNVDFRNRLVAALNTNRKLIFIPSEWGAGKTFQLFCFAKSESARKLSIHYRSFFGVRTTEEAFGRTLHPVTKFFFALLSLFFYVVPLYKLGENNFFSLNEKTTALQLFAQCAVVLLGFYIFSKQWRIVYVLFCIFETIFRALYGLLDVQALPGKRVVILDDLDRSSLSDADRWGFLSTLWTSNVQYVVPLGHMSEADSARYSEIIKKLNGVSVKLTLSAKEKAQIVRSYLWKEAPFVWMDREVNFHWLELFTLRELASIGSHVESTYADMDPRLRKFIGAFFLYRELSRKLGVPIQVRTYQGIHLDGTSLNVSVDKTLGDRQNFTSHNLNSFKESITSEIMDALKLFSSFPGRPQQAAWLYSNDVSDFANALRTLTNGQLSGG